MSCNVRRESKMSVTPPRDGLVAFTDGACSKNGRPGATAGYAVVWPNHPDHTLSKPLAASLGMPPTNNRAEYTGLLEALKIANQIDPTLTMPLYIYTDSMLLVNSINKWIHSSI